MSSRNATRPSAATDETDRVTFVAGADAKANYAQRLAVGIDAFRAGIRNMFLGE